MTEEAVPGAVARERLDSLDSQRVIESMRAPFSEAVGKARFVPASQTQTRAGHHRMPPVDVLLAALAERYELGVLHYDHDYDALAAKTDLRFSSVWLVPPGSL